jgi:hypothetical protein
MDLSEKPHLSLIAQPLQLVYDWLRSTKNEGHFNWRTKYSLRCISRPIGGIFLKLHTHHSLWIPYSWYRFACDRSITKGTYLMNKNLLSCISPSIEGIFLKRDTCHSRSMPYNWYKFGCDRSITKGTLFEEQSTYSAILRLLFEGFFGTPHLSFTAHALQYYLYKFTCDR